MFILADPILIRPVNNLTSTRPRRRIQRAPLPQSPSVLSLLKIPSSEVQSKGKSSMTSSAVDASGNPIPTSAVLMSSSKHIAAMCRSENMTFINCKDPNPEKCLDKGRQVTSCVLNLLKNLHQSCAKEMDAYAGCMYYHTNEFDLCRKEQQEFEAACPWSTQ